MTEPEMFPGIATDVTFADETPPVTEPTGTPDPNWTRTDRYRFYLRQLPIGTVFDSHKMMEWSGNPIKMVYNTMQQLYTLGELRRVGLPASGQYATTDKLRKPTGKRVSTSSKAKRVKIVAKKASTFETVGNINDVVIVRDVATHTVYALRDLEV